ncbi:MAG: DHH family phosphoesterase [Deltaproteobacteria bacterium]|jgi:phosphoesterase RecJ-like protein|nr:DHH family phosphoesterase [Deltaproteobacteria bacterium]
MNEQRQMREKAAEIAAILRRRDNILVASHAEPDGDAIGATSAMGLLLQALGKRFALYNASGLPQNYSWVKMPQPLFSSLEDLPFAPELLITLDCGEMHRLGPESPLLEALPAIHLDHHLGNPHEGLQGSWVDPNMASAGQMVAEVARAANIPLSGPLAEGVCLSLASDTGSFSFGNADAAVFRLMAEMLDNGLEYAELRQKMDAQWSLAKSSLWGRLLGKIESLCGGRLLLCVIHREDLDACGAVSGDLEGFVELLRRHGDVEIAATLREDAQARCKLSMRSFGGVDVRALAVRFGGGGHKNAAAATIREPVDDAQAKVIAAARDFLDSHG